MRKDRIAEFILSLTMPADRAASMVGDLMEDFAGHTFHFWSYVLRTELSYVRRGFAAEPFQLLFGAAVGWLAYLFISGFFVFIVDPILSVAWGISSFFIHHRGLDLLADLAKVRIEWYQTGPHWLYQIVGKTIRWIIVPFQLG